MKVVINRQTTFGRKAGIGNYTAQLLHHMRLQAGENQVEGFPARSLAFIWKSWTAFSSLAENIPKSHEGLDENSWRAAWSRRRTILFQFNREVGRAAVGRYFRASCAREGYDLYHEPNFIPLHSDLPTLATLHDLSVLLHPGWHPDDRVAYFYRNFRRGIAQCAHFLVVSDFIRAEVIHHLNIPPQRVSRVYNGIRPGLGPLPPEEVACQLKRLGLPPRYLLYLGTIEPRKNLLMLLQAYCSLPRALREEWPLLLVGNLGWKTAEVAEYLHREARHRGVIRVGYLPSTALPAVYNGARALVYPSFYEGFGLPPIEMLACGGAVLSSTAGALVETLGRQAHFVNPRDSDGWRQALQRVLQDHDWWQSLRAGARQSVSQYSWERCARETLQVYRKVCGVQGGNNSLLPAAAQGDQRAAA